MLSVTYTHAAGGMATVVKRDCDDGYHSDQQKINEVVWPYKVHLHMATGFRPCVLQVGWLLGAADAGHVCGAVPLRGSAAVGGLAAGSGGALHGMLVRAAVALHVVESCCCDWCCFPS
jgi:hypothetical protein